ASVARHQGWDALMQYAYSEVSLSERGPPSNWHSFNDPSLLATLPAAALLYRRGDVKEASMTYVFAPSSKTLFFRSPSPKDSIALRTAPEVGKLVVALPHVRELPWVKSPNSYPINHVNIKDPSHSALGATDTYSRSDTGELTHDWGNGIYAI